MDWSCDATGMVNIRGVLEDVLGLERWSPRGRPWPRGRHRGHILKSLASKVKSLALASKPQVLENWPVLGSRTVLFFEPLKFRWKTPETSRKLCDPFLFSSLGA